VCVAFVKPFIFTGIPRGKTGLFHIKLSFSESFIDAVGGLLEMSWNTELCRDTTIWSLSSQISGLFQPLGCDDNPGEMFLLLGQHIADGIRVLRRAG